MKSQSDRRVILLPAKISFIKGDRQFNIGVPGSKVGEKDHIERDTSIDLYTKLASSPLLSSRQRRRIKKRVLKEVKKRKKKKGTKILGKIALVTAGVLIPPFGLVLLVTWLIYRTRPKNKAKRLATEALQLAEHNPGAALPLLEEAHKLNPADNDILAAAGYASHNAEDYKMAWRFLKELGRHTRLSSSELYLLGHSLYETGQYDKAIEVLQSIPEDYDQYNKVILLLGGCFAEREDIDGAIEVIQRGPLRSLNMDDDLKEMHYQLGLLYASQDNMEAANFHFKRLYAADVTYRDIKERVDLTWKQNPSAMLPLDIPAQIRALADLQKEGVLSEDEFEKKKKDLLKRL